MTQTSIPQVLGDHLLLQEYSRTKTSVPVGSHHWYTWLADAQNRSFSFKSHAGAFTARHERQRNSWYWYAYRKQHGKIRKVYLGRPQELTSDRLNTVAVALSRSHTCLHHEQQVITSKLTIPPLPTHLLARPRLLNKLQQGVQGRLTLLSAPAGWGKTTLLRQWCGEQSTQHIRLSWLSLDKGDNQPARFWSHFIAALDHIFPGLSDSVSPDLFTQPSLIGHGLQALLNALSRLAKHATLILDNYQAITAPDIHQAIITFLELMPAQLHVVIASRVDPPLPLARLRAQRQLMELRINDLRFSLQEVSQLLPQLVPVSFTTGQCAALVTRTEGWITALHLIASAIGEGAPVDDAVAAPQRYITDYLIEEVLFQQPQEVQNFLLATSVLDSFNLSLAEAVCDQPNAQAILDYLTRSNLFIEAQYQRQSQFRYHSLFAEALQAHLRQTQAILLPALYTRARAWHQQNGLLAESLQYARKAIADDMPIKFVLSQEQQPGIPHAAPRTAHSDLFTEREHEVIQLLLQGASNRDIASRLIISEGTVKKHVSNICGKLGVKSRTQAISKIINVSVPA